MLTTEQPNAQLEIGSPYSASPEVKRVAVRLTFDKGTILLRSDDSGLKLQFCPEVLWDERVRSYRAPASSYKSLLCALKSQGLEIQDSVPYSWGAAMKLVNPALRPY